MLLVSYPVDVFNYKLRKSFCSPETSALMPKKCFLIFIHLKGVCPSRHRKSLGSLLRRIELRSRSYTNLDFRFPPMLTSRCHFCAANHPQPSLDFISRLSIFKQRKGTKICLWDNSEHIKVEETFLFFLRYLAHLFNRAFLILLFFPYQSPS